MRVLVFEFLLYCVDDILVMFVLYCVDDILANFNKFKQKYKMLSWLNIPAKGDIYDLAIISHTRLSKHVT